MRPRVGERSLREDTRTYLTTLRLTRTNPSRCEVMIAHASPDDMWRSVCTDPMTQRVKRMVGNLTGSVRVLRHTHIAMALRDKDVRIVNPGSVSDRRPRDRHTDAVLPLPARQLEVIDLKRGKGSIMPWVSRRLHGRV